MMKSLTTALGALTILTVTGMATPPGQAMLGIRQTQTATPVSSIPDPGPVKAATPAPAPVTPAPASAPAATPRAAAPAASPAARPAAPVARPVAPAASPAASAPAPAANPMGGAGAITNILLNLPQVLQGTQGGSGVSNGWTPPGQRARKHNDGNGNNGGDQPER